ncbi:hypothetical protein DKX15_14825, partial [Enterococcus faecium]
GAHEVAENEKGPPGSYADEHGSAQVDRHRPGVDHLCAQGDQNTVAAGVCHRSPRKVTANLQRSRSESAGARRYRRNGHLAEREDRHDAHPRDHHRNVDGGTGRHAGLCSVRPRRPRAAGRRFARPDD